MDLIDIISPSATRGSRADEGVRPTLAQSGMVQISAVGKPAEGFAVHSYRSATTGSRRAALFAGQMPKNRPTATDTTMPNTADHNGTLAGREAKTARLMSEMIQPNRIPQMPPMPVNTAASSKN